MTDAHDVDDELQRVEHVIETMDRSWFDAAGVLEVSPCIKVIQGVAQGSYAVGIFVAHKLSEEGLAEQAVEPIPAQIDGVPTDVIATHQRPLGTVDERATRSAMFDTLIGGISVGNSNLNAYGTLGLSLLANDDGRLVGLTNEHVLVFDGDGAVGDPVEQPRFYLNSQVSIDPASCCPGGQLRYRGVDNPIVDAAAAVFAAAGVAAVLSDEIDPHRRGQEATPVADGERTHRETVQVAIDLTELPLPGTPFKANVDWSYERHTDQRVLVHGVGEAVQNRHHTSFQRLFTNRTSYSPGDQVILVAALAEDAYTERCNYLVTAAVLSPSHRQADKVILRPWHPRERAPFVATHVPDEPAPALLGEHVSDDLRGRCLYAGITTLPVDAELGTWTTYLFATTVNDVALGTDPLQAARTIGGLPVSDNFQSAGATTHILYGKRCNIELRPNGKFEVELPEDVVIG